MWRPKRKKRPRMTDKTGPQVRCQAHLKWLRGNMCVVTNEGCSGATEAHHVRLGGDGGMGVKPGDDRAVGLCALHHAALHTYGQRSFNERWNVDLAEIAATYWKASPHGIKYRAYQEERDG